VGEGFVRVGAEDCRFRALRNDEVLRDVSTVMGRVREFILHHSSLLFGGEGVD